MINKLLIGLWVIGTATVLGVCLALALTGGVECTTDAECMQMHGHKELKL